MCLDRRADCKQYECVPRYPRCTKLLKNAMLLHEGKSFKNPHHRYNAYEVYSNCVLTVSFLIRFLYISLYTVVSGIYDSGIYDNPPYTTEKPRSLEFSYLHHVFLSGIYDIRYIRHSPFTTSFLIPLG